MVGKTWITIAGIVCLGIAPAYAQEVSAGITGRVTDPSGSAIVGASVTAKDLDRGTEWPTTTNEEGIYSFPRIPIGHYTIKVETKGFKTAQSQVTLEVNQRARLDMAMEVGVVAETVTVSGEAALLQTDTTQVGSVVASSQIDHTPLISRNPIALTLLTAGVTTPDPSSFNSGQRTAGGGRPYVNGNREESNNFLLDGVDNNFTSDNLVSYQPNPDAIEEFKLITNNASAEFGNFQGGIINVVIKSGTNQFHGDVFEYFRNDKLNANNWGNNWNSVPRGALRWNQFGGTRRRPHHQGQAVLLRGLPRAAAEHSAVGLLRDGDADGVAQRRFLRAARHCPDRRQSHPALQSVFAGRHHRAARSVSEQHHSRQPAESGGGEACSTTRRSIRRRSTTGSRHRITTTPVLELFLQRPGRPQARLAAAKKRTTSRPASPKAARTTRASTPSRCSITASTRRPSRTASSTGPAPSAPGWSTKLRVGVNNVMLDNGGADKGLGNIAQQAGIQNAGTGPARSGPGLSTADAFNWATGIGNANIGVQQLFANTTFHYADNLTIIRGRHMMKMGGQLLREWINVFYSGNNGRSGYINFTGRFTAQNAASPARHTDRRGRLHARSARRHTAGACRSGTWGQRSTIYGFYFQDDWRATNSLTLNLGLRWEYHTPWVEVENRQANFDEFTGQLDRCGATSLRTWSRRPDRRRG